MYKKKLLIYFHILERKWDITQNCLVYMKNMKIYRYIHVQVKCMHSFFLSKDICAILILCYDV